MYPERTNKKSGMESFTDVKSKTETAGYMSTERRIKALQHAGQILQQSREQQFDGDKENYVAPPFRGLQPDLAELSQLARENQQKMNIIKQKAYDRHKRLAQAEQDQGDSPEKPSLTLPSENETKTETKVSKTKSEESTK